MSLFLRLSIYINLLLELISCLQGGGIAAWPAAKNSLQRTERDPAQSQYRQHSWRAQKSPKRSASWTPVLGYTLPLTKLNFLVEALICFIEKVHFIVAAFATLQV